MYGGPVIRELGPGHRVDLSARVAVLGRIAAYTGQRVTWNFLAEESTLDLFPQDLAWDASRPPPSHAIPGRTKLV